MLVVPIRDGHRQKIPFRTFMHQSQQMKACNIENSAEQLAICHYSQRTFSRRQSRQQWSIFPKSRDCGWSGDLFKEPCGKESRTTVFTFIRMVLSLSECTYPSEPRLLYLCLLFSSKHSQLYYFWNLQSADFPPKFSFSTLSIQLLFSILLCFLYCIIGQPHLASLVNSFL